MYQEGRFITRKHGWKDSENSVVGKWRKKLWNRTEIAFMKTRRFTRRSILDETYGRLQLMVKTWWKRKPNEKWAGSSTWNASANGEYDRWSERDIAFAEDSCAERSTGEDMLAALVKMNAVKLWKIAQIWTSIIAGLPLHDKDYQFFS